MKDQAGTIYILKFSPPVKHAQYYVGWTSRDPRVRLNEHLSGRGCPLVRHAYENGHAITIYAVMHGTRTDERRIKNRKNTPKLVASLERRGLTVSQPDIHFRGA